MPVISFKVTEAEAREIRRRAKREHATLSAYLRKKAIEETTTKPSEIVYTTCPVTGAKIFGHNPDFPPPSVEDVRRMMAEFP